jgi:anti-sigma factor RsiW
VQHDFADEAALYVLGVLTDADKAAFEAHLSVCAVCAAEVRGFALVIEALASTPPEAAPSADARRILLARLRVDVESPNL